MRVHDVGMTIVGLEGEDVSEGQAVQVTGLHRIEVRYLQDALRSLMHALQADGEHQKQHDIRMALRCFLGDDGEDALREWLGYSMGESVPLWVPCARTGCAAPARSAEGACAEHIHEADAAGSES